MDVYHAEPLLDQAEDEYVHQVDPEAIIASDIGNFRELSEKYSVIVTFPKNDIETLRKEIEKLVTDDNYYNMIKEHFTQYYNLVRPSTMVKIYLEEYKNII
jgi:hypothetical protein